MWTPITKCVHKFSNWKLQKAKEVKASVLPKSVPVHVKTVKKTNVVAKSNSAATRASTVSTVPGPRLVSGIHSSNPTLLPDLTYAFPSGDDTSTGESWLIKFTAAVIEKVHELAGHGEKYGTYVAQSHENRPVPSPIDNSSSESVGKLNSCKTGPVVLQGSCVDWMNRKVGGWQGQTFVTILLGDHYVFNGYTGVFKPHRRKNDGKLLHTLSRDYYRFVWGEKNWYNCCKKTSYRVEPIIPSVFKAHVEAYLFEPLIEACLELCHRLMKEYIQRMKFMRGLLLQLKDSPARTTPRDLAVTAITNAKSAFSGERKRDLAFAKDKSSSDRALFILFGVYSGSRVLRIMDEALGVAYDEYIANNFNSVLLPWGWGRLDFNYAVLDED